MTISNEDLRGLSAVEQEALLGMDEGDEDVLHELGTVSVTDEDDDTALHAAAQEAPAIDVQDAAEEEPLLPPLPERMAPQDADTQRQMLRSERALALQKLMDGEITPDVFQQVDSIVQDHLDVLVRAEASDQARAQINHDAMLQDYSRELNTMYRELRSAGLDIEATANEFDRAIRLFAQDAEARGLTDRPGHIDASKAALQDARDLLLRRYGVAPAVAPAPAPAATSKPARTPRTLDRSSLPPSLAHIPTAADASVAGEFAHLEGLEGAALERAIARLSPDQQERYLD